jgi:nucleoside-diphosphate-sugar epimerase
MSQKETSQEIQPAYLVTGGMGCIGAWVLHFLVQKGLRVVNFDLSTDRHRLDLLLSRAEQESITFVRGDLTDPQQVQEVFAVHSIRRVIHLAALQVPFCKANPVIGAQVNVVGTINVFEAARQNGVKHLAYASSVAVYGPPSPDQAGQVVQDAPLNPSTLYGVYKIANESSARVYWQDHGISSTALRPYTVYGIGRDQGFTSGPTMAMLAVAAGKPYHIPFNGPCQYHYAADVARQFIEAADQAGHGASVYNLGGLPVPTTRLIEIIRSTCPEAQVTCSDAALPFPAGFDDTLLRESFNTVYATPLEDGVSQTIDQFRTLIAAGLIQAP